MLGRSAAFRNLLEQLQRVSRCEATVLIEGETGTGKELAAREIHYRGPRGGQPFVPVNCGALPDSLLENELFGHARGAYTDARTDQPGLVQIADGGTLFLDEVDALSAKAQVSLLRFLQDQRYRPLGSRREVSGNVRIVAACNRPLERRVADGEFRADLLYRLNLLQLRIPPLRERHGDPTLLARHFVSLASRRYALPERPLSRNTLGWLERHAWPGNIRELENRISQAALMCDADQIDAEDPRAQPAASLVRDAEPRSYRVAKDRAIAEFEERFLSQAMQEADGNVSAAARLIGTERRHLGRLLKKYRIERPLSAG